jgi:hypothetical protein
MTAPLCEAYFWVTNYPALLPHGAQWRYIPDVGKLEIKIDLLAIVVSV